MGQQHAGIDDAGHPVRREKVSPITKRHDDNFGKLAHAVAERADELRAAVVITVDRNGDIDVVIAGDLSAVEVVSWLEATKFRFLQSLDT